MAPTNSNQIDLLVRFMERNPNIAKNYFPTGNAKMLSKTLWQQLGDDLNSCGPPIKTTEGWKTVWKDFRYNLKRKMRDNFLHRSGTGGGPFKQKFYSENEKAVIAILDLNEAVSGNPAGKTFGEPQINVPICNSPMNQIEEQEEEDSFPMETNEDNAVIFENIENVAANTTRTPSLPKRANKKKRNSMLEQHVNMQEEVLKVLGDRLTSIENTQKCILKELERSNRYKKEAERQSRKMFALKKEKFEEYKKNNLRKTKTRLDLIEIKSKKLELNQTKMEIGLKKKVPNQSSDSSSED